MDMDEQRLRKTFKYQLMPTPEQERTLEIVVWRCRELYTLACRSAKPPGKSAASA
jgi:hypothetical protein